MTSKQAIISLLQEDWTSPLTALREAGSMKLSTRVSELRKEGYVIEQRPVTYKTIFGRITKYNEYRIKKED